MVKKRLHIALIILALASSVCSASAQDLRNYISLQGDWHFSIGDNPDWARYHYNHHSWEKIKVPSTWERQGFNGYDGYAWYRREVKIPADANKESLWLELGYIDDADEVYLNGELINRSGSFPPNFKTAYNAHRMYKIPAQHIRYGQSNVIAIRVYDAYNEGGIHSGNIRILSELNPLLLDIPLEGQWKFKTGDKKQYKTPEHSDSQWDKIAVPSAWEEQGYANYDGLAWYRIKVELPDNLLNQNLVLILGKIDDVDEAYVNGELIGQTGEINFEAFEYQNAWQTQRGYTIPKHIYADNKTLTIAVRVQDRLHSGGIYKGPIGIITQEKYIAYWNAKRKR